MENPDLQEEFGLTIGSPWRANSWRLEDSPQAKPTLECKGAMGRMTGWRGDMVIFDDLLEINAVSSEAIRQKLQAWIDTEVLPAINPTENEKVIVVGTRKHLDDWYGQLLINPDYVSRVDRAFLDKAQTKTLWPHVLDEEGNPVAEMFTAERLHERKREIGTLRFEQEYMNNPSPPEGLEWRMSWLKYYEQLPEQYRLRYYMGIDPSSGSSHKKTTSHFAMCVVAHDTEYDDIYIVAMYRGKDSKREQEIKALGWAAKYAPEAIYIENVFEYTHVYEAVRKQFPSVHPIDYIHTPIKGTQAVKKEERIKNICGPAFEYGRLLLKKPELDPYIKTFLEHEYRPFPLGDMDMLDALTLAIHHLAKGAVIKDVPWYFP
jgi:hypothetical protein